MTRGIAIVLAILTSSALAQTTHAAAASPTHAAFLTFESGVLVAVDWVVREGQTIHSHALMNQSLILDADIQVRPDGSTVHSTVIVTNAGGERGKPIEHTYDSGAVCWNDYMTGSIQLVIDRARVLSQSAQRIPAASLFSATKGEILVMRLGPTDWTVSYHNKRYDVLTDEQGQVLTASLPEYGVTVERRDEFAAERYAPWPPNQAPPDHAYRAQAARIPAPQGHVLAGTLTLPNGKGPWAVTRSRRRSHATRPSRPPIGRPRSGSSSRSR